MIIVNVIDKITKKQINPNIPSFRVGDTVKVNVKIIEGNKERVQAYEGVVTARKGGGISAPAEIHTSSTKARQY